MPGVHHVYARGNNRGRIFRDDDDREDYLLLFGKEVARRRWRCLTYCLMDNHVHLLVETETANLGAGMQRLHGLYGRSFNDRHGQTGHVFQGRYGSVPMTSDEQLWWLVSYIAHNPVAAGLCRSAREWRWSSHAAVLDGGGPPWLATDRLLDHFEPAGGDPRQRYAELIGK